MNTEPQLRLVRQALALAGIVWAWLLGSAVLTVLLFSCTYGYFIPTGAPPPTYRTSVHPNINIGLVERPVYHNEPDSSFMVLVVATITTLGLFWSFVTEWHLRRSRNIEHPAYFRLTAICLGIVSGWLGSAFIIVLCLTTIGLLEDYTEDDTVLLTLALSIIGIIASIIADMTYRRKGQT